MKNLYKVLTLLIFSGFIWFWYLNYVSANQPRIISKIDPRFCNWRIVTNRLELKQVSVNQEIEVCLAALNSADIDLNVKMYFVDWIEDPKTKQISCASEKAVKMWLSKFISFPVNKHNQIESETDILYYKIKAWETLEKRAKLKFPEAYRWKSHWCLITQVSDQVMEKWKINILVRRANIISANADWSPNYSIRTEWNFIEEDGRVLISKNSDIFVVRDMNTDQLLIWTNLENTWNTQLGLNIDFLLNWNWVNLKNSWEIQLMPWEIKPIAQAFSGISTFWLWYKTSINISYSPIFDYKTDYTDNQSLIEAKSNKLNYEFNLIPLKTILLILLLIILALIWFIRFFCNIKTKSSKIATKDYIVKKWDTIDQIAATYWITWKKLAAINKLKPPYDIRIWDILTIQISKSLVSKVKTKQKLAISSPNKKLTKNTKIKTSKKKASTTIRKAVKKQTIVKKPKAKLVKKKVATTVTKKNVKWK